MPTDLEDSQTGAGSPVWKFLKGVDRLYVWSALIGLLCALVLIGLAQIWANRG